MDSKLLWCKVCHGMTPHYWRSFADWFCGACGVSQLKTEKVEIEVKL